MRMGWVELRISYPVDLDNESMVNHAMDAIFDDVFEIGKGSIEEIENDSIEFIVDKSGILTEGNIPEFLKDDFGYDCTIGEEKEK